MARITLAMEAALGELCHYSQFGRYREEFQQQAYLILSHCGLLLSSLVVAETDVPSGILVENRALGTLFARLCREVPHDYDYRLQPLRTDDREIDLTGDTRWFEFWGKVLRHAEQATAPEIEHFSERLLGSLVVDDQSHTKSIDKPRKALADLLNSSETGRLLQHSIGILEDLIGALIDFFAQLDPAVHMREQVQVMTCILSHIRHTVVCESMAKGPYSMRDDVGWEPSWVRRRVARGRSLGQLTVAAADESGELICTYTRASGSKVKERSWSRAIAALPCIYQEMLFKTWSYQTGEYLRIVDLFGQPEACWVVDHAEADRLETICKRMDGLLEKLSVYQAFCPVGERLARLARSGQARWTPTELPWTFIRDLDRAIEGLRFACREANVLGGDSAMAEVLSQLWPSESPAPDAETTDPTTESGCGVIPDHTETSAHDDMPRHTQQVSMESAASAIGQSRADEVPAGPEEAVDEAGQTPSSDDWPPQPETSLAGGNEPPSAPEDERPKQARRRVEKLATTMNILLGESYKRKDEDSSSST